MFSRLTNDDCKTVKANHLNINKATDSFNQSILRAAFETIPRGAQKNYRPYWTEELQKLEYRVFRTREKVKNNPMLQNNIAHVACTSKYWKAYIQATKTRWRDKTEKLNLDRDGNKLWKMTRAMNDEETRSSPVMIQRDKETVTRKRAANCFTVMSKSATSRYQITGSSKCIMKSRTTKLIKIYLNTWTAHLT